MGYIITRWGIKTDPKQSKQLSILDSLRIKKWVRQFLGMVQYYHYLLPKLSDILAMHTELTKGGPTKNGPVECTPDCTEEFQQMKALISKETILIYTDLSKQNNRDGVSKRTQNNLSNYQYWTP